MALHVSLATWVRITLEHHVGFGRDLTSLDTDGLSENRQGAKRVDPQDSC